MKSRFTLGWAVGLTILLARVETFAAEVPAAPSAAPTAASVPPTLWSFLGLKQTADKYKKHLTVHKEKKAEKQALQGGHACLKRLFGPLCPCGCPKCEILKKKPPLAPLADPANLESPNPAIKAAAEIKAEEELAPQKIKAIRYLSTIGCRCYPQVKPALLAALDDCTEEVRYEAALAFCRSAGNPCTVCNSSTCCDPDVRKKLADLASGMDDQDCWKEPSPRVRSAAAGALNACEMIAPAESLPEEEPRELPVPEMAPQEERPESAATESASLTPVTVNVSDSRSDAPNVSVSEPSEGGPAGERAAPFAGGSDGRSNPIPALAVSRPRRHTSSCRPQRAGPTAGQKPQTGMPPEEAEPGERGPEEAPFEESREPSATDLAGTFGAAAGPQSAAPYMIGDFFGGSASQVTIVRSFAFGNLVGEYSQDGTFYTVVPGEISSPRVAVHDLLPNQGGPPYEITGVNDASGQLGGPPLASVPAGGSFLGGVTTGGQSPDYLFTSQFAMQYMLTIPSPGTGGGVGRMKIADNTSPMPRDRLIFDYGYFDNVPLAPGGVNVNRLTLGLEKTFLDGMMSFELKAPMASTVDSTFVQGMAANEGSGEFGNLALTWKTLLRQTETWAFSGGLQLGLPTADDSRVVLEDGTPLLVLQNDAVHLGPFFGALWTPNERLFSQGFLQCDVASVGNTVMVNRNLAGLSEAGRLNDVSLLTLDWGIGYWALRNSCRQRGLTGLAWTAELHWTRSLQDPDAVVIGPWDVTANSNAGRIDDLGINVLDLTLGCHLAWRERTLVTCGYAMPLDVGSEQPFDGEFRLMVNHHFGPSSRLTPMTL